VYPALEGTITPVGNFITKHFRTFLSTLRFTLSTLGKKTGKFPSGTLVLNGAISYWRFVYEKIKFTVAMWLGSTASDVETEVGLSIGSTDQATIGQISMPLDDATRR
jgi:hypothetical protein